MTMVQTLQAVPMLERQPAVDFSPASRRQSGAGLRVILVGFQDQDNLGLRYLSAAALHYGHRARIVTYSDDPTTLVDVVMREQPALVGFSLIFQYMAPSFGRVIKALRAAGYRGHLTIGGHYPSFDPHLILQRIPGLDSVVRYEGEMTLCELLECLQSGQDWRGISGIAWADEAGTVVENPIRGALADLDKLPLPHRLDIEYERQEVPTASILGSRGCSWNCSFCSIRPFYEAMGGKLRRLRTPEAVAGEMLELHTRRGVAAFLFQDDDFMATGPRARTWAVGVAEQIFETDMRGRVALKMSCRSDEVHEPTLRTLRDLGGLSHVYLGVESGSEESLVHLNKQEGVAAHLRAGEVFRRLGLSFDFGFMMLEPYSELNTVRENINFLERFVGDGWTVARFCRTLPYAGTPLKRKLEEEGRLLGTAFEPDYQFLDPKLDYFYDWMLRTFHVRNFTDEGLCRYLSALQFELHLRVDGRLRATAAEQAYGRYLTSVCNRVALYTLRAALDHIQASSLADLERDTEYLDGLTRHEHAQERQLMAEVDAFYETWRRRWRSIAAPGVPQTIPGAARSRSIG